MGRVRVVVVLAATIACLGTAIAPAAPATAAPTTAGPAPAATSTGLDVGNAFAAPMASSGRTGARRVRPAAVRPPTARPAAVGPAVRWYTVDLGLALNAHSHKDRMTLAALSAGVAAVDDFYSRNTGGLLRFRVGQTRTWTATRSACSLDVPYRLARAAHWTVSTRTVVVAYQPEACLFSGMAELAGNYVILAEGGQVATMAHEFGHILGLGHSGLSGCSTAFGRLCSVRADESRFLAYADGTDLMGGAQSRQLAVYARQRIAGTLSPAQLALLHVPFRATRIDLASVRAQLRITLAPRVDRVGFNAVSIVWNRRTYWLSYVGGVLGQQVTETNTDGTAFPSPLGQVVVQTGLGPDTELLPPSSVLRVGAGIGDGAVLALPLGKRLFVRTWPDHATLIISPPDPATPAAVSAAAVGEDLMVTWTPAADPAVTGYAVEARTGDTVLTTQVPAGSSTATIPGTMPGGSYRVLVFPVRGSVRGLPGRAAATVTLLPVPPTQIP